VITLESVSKSYDGGLTYAVHDVTLTVEESSLLVLLGESGCGKTTTLKTINRLEELFAGRITVAGEDIHNADPVQLRRRIGYVFQGIGLFPHLTVAENIGTVPKLLGWSSGDIEARVNELLDMIGMQSTVYSERYPRELSGGQQQRIGVARALAARPNVLLMDEPFGALDPITRDGLQEQLKDLQKSLGLTVVLVTHDMTEALLLADMIAVMKEGQVLGYGTPSELMSDPQHEYVRNLMAMPKRQADRVAQIANPAP
jgi:osmoprotectant transport system ATP-binding protein